MDKRLKELKTRAIVLRRTNYGEADRILNLITPEGKIAVIAKGVRKAKSKLAGSVEMFTVSQVNLHFGKSDMATLTGAKMVRFYGGILKDLTRMEVASGFLKEINRSAEMIDSPEFFEILDKCLLSIENEMRLDLVEGWFLLNIARVMGEQMNLYTDVNGNKLDVLKRYRWNEMEMSLEEDERGEVDADMIKLMRLLWSADLEVIFRIKNTEQYLPEILKIAQAIKKVIK